MYCSFSHFWVGFIFQIRMLPLAINTQIISKLEKKSPGCTHGKMTVSFESVNFRRANPVAHISNLLADALPGLKVITCEAALDR